MLEFFQQYGAEILAGLTAAAAAVTSVVTMVKAFKTGKKVDANIARQDNEIQITRDGIVEAFKTAKIPSEWKIDVSNKIEKAIEAGLDQIIELFKEYEGLRTDANILILKILSYTAASNKLTEDDKNKIADLLKLIGEKDSTINIE